MVLLQHTLTGKTIWVISVHLSAGETNERETFRLKQLKAINERIKQLPEANAYLLAGDMNSDPKLKYMYQEQIHSYLGNKYWTNISGFNSTYYGWAKLTFDYIYTKGLSHNRIIIERLIEPGPNKNQGSDHTAVTCILTLDNLPSEIIKNKYYLINDINGYNSVFVRKRPDESTNDDNFQCYLLNGEVVTCIKILTPFVYVKLSNNTFGYIKQKHLQDISSIGSDIPKTISLLDINGNIVICKQNNTTGLDSVFKYPIFLSDSSYLSSKQNSEHPVLIMSETDWKYISDPSNTHSGAFGNDFHIINITHILISGFNTIIECTGTDKNNWVLVWKFPYDLNNLFGYLPIYNIPLPVGSYLLINDGWHQSSFNLSFPIIGDNSLVVKYRIDKENVSLHYLSLKNEGDINLLNYACISTTYFIRGFWKITRAERLQLVAMLKELEQQAKIFAFSCYQQHHIIVLYADISDIKNPSFLTPSYLASILAEKNRGRIVRNILNKYSFYTESNIDIWIRNYIQHFYERLNK